MSQSGQLGLENDIPGNIPVDFVTQSGTAIAIGSVIDII